MRESISKTTKTDRLISLLKAKRGKTIVELSEALGWQTHTTRAALTRLRQADHKIERISAETKVGAGRYRIVEVSK